MALGELDQLCKLSLGLRDLSTSVVEDERDSVVLLEIDTPSLPLSLVIAINSEVDGASVIIVDVYSWSCSACSSVSVTDAP